jgi:hypothetical protein
MSGNELTLSNLANLAANNATLAQKAAGQAELISKTVQAKAREVAITSQQILQTLLQTQQMTAGIQQSVLAVQESAAKALDLYNQVQQLGLGSIATQDAFNVTITGGTLSGLSSVGLRESTTFKYDLTLSQSGTLTASRALTLDVHNASRALSLSGDLTVNSGGATIGGLNTGDQTFSITGDVSASGSTSVLNATVTKLNGVSLAALGTGLVKNTTGTGVPSIALPGVDYTAGLTRVGPKTAAYTANANEIISTNATAGIVPILLPNAPRNGTIVCVKMIATASSNTTTITCQGADVFNKTGGGTSLTLQLLNQGAILVYDSVGQIWTVMSDDLSLSQLDLRYMLTVSFTLATNAVVISPALIASQTTRIKQVNTQAAGTLTINNPTGTPVDGQLLVFRIKSTNSQSYVFGSMYAGANLTLPSATSGSSKTDRLVFEYDSDAAKFILIGISVGA